MRSFSFIALAVATLSLAACARKDILPPGDPFADKPWVIDETLPVPIRFGKGDLFQIETKGTETALTSLAGKKVAITALTSFEEVRSDTLDKKTMLFNGDIATVDADGNVSFDAGNHYYPMPGQEDTVRNYSFYAYRITTDENTTDETDDKTPVIGESGHLNDYIDFDLNPETNNVDVLWAKAQAKDYSGLQGFNAKYIRAVTAAGEAAKAEFYPKFAFTHSAAAIRFKVKSDGTEKSEYQQKTGDACDFTIDSITVGGIYNKVRLSLATGALTKRSVAAAFRQYPAAAVVPDPNPANFGNDLFIVPGSEPKTISVHFTDKEGTSGATSSSNLSVPPGGYVAGHIYTYTIVIASPVQMSSSSISATLGDWTENDMGVVNVFQES